jgi:hypothetical protein
MLMHYAVIGSNTNQGRKLLYGGRGWGEEDFKLANYKVNQSNTEYEKINTIIFNVFEIMF